MRLFIIKILLRLLGDKSYKAINEEMVKSWLMGLADEKCGYKGYYTIRKKAILDLIGLGLEQKEYWLNMGKLSELKHINFLTEDLIKKYADQKGKIKEGGVK